MSCFMSRNGISCWSWKTKLFGIILSICRHGEAERAPSLVGVCCCTWGLIIFPLTWSFIKCLREAAEAEVQLLPGLPAGEGSSHCCIRLSAELLLKLDK